MKLTKILLVAAALVGGIYIASEEGKQIRKALEKKKSAFKPIVNDLLDQASKILKGADSIKSSQIRANVEKLISEAKTALTEINLELTIDTIKDAIKVASEKIRHAFHVEENYRNSTVNKDETEEIIKSTKKSSKNKPNHKTTK